MKEYMTKYISDRVNLLLQLFDEEITVLSSYEYVDTDFIERTWDSQIKRMAKYMGVSEGTYELIEWYFLDGYIVVADGQIIDDKDELISYLVEETLKKTENAE